MSCRAYIVGIKEPCRILATMERLLFIIGRPVPPPFPTPPKVQP